jgi:hypothetical protein
MRVAGAAVRCDMATEEASGRQPEQKRSDPDVHCATSWRQALGGHSSAWVHQRPAALKSKFTAVGATPASTAPIAPAPASCLPRKALP